METYVFFLISLLLAKHNNRQGQLRYHGRTKTCTQINLRL